MPLDFDTGQGLQLCCILAPEYCFVCSRATRLKHLATRSFWLSQSLSNQEPFRSCYSDKLILSRFYSHTETPFRWGFFSVSSCQSGTELSQSFGCAFLLDNGSKISTVALKILLLRFFGVKVINSVIKILEYWALRCLPLPCSCVQATFEAFSSGFGFAISHLRHRNVCCV